MMRLLVKSRKRFASNVALFASFVNFLSPAICYTKVSEDQMLSAIAASGMDKPEVMSSSYTVNFNNVPAIEVIRFVSKITSMNFVFNEGDIQFNVTIISEEPITVKNIMSALIQVLRINGLTLLEQDNNLIITKSTDVNQIPTIVSGDIPSSENTSSPIITRVFRIKNASVSSLANIIRPLTSRSALIEVSPETRQLIVTDITTNVEKIGSLLASLDAPHTPLEIDSYEVKNVSAADVIILTNQLLSPFTEGNPLILVPQLETNTIFIVSTPYLIERALSVMEDIDTPAKTVVVGQKNAPEQNIHVYKIMHRNGEDFLRLVSDVADKLQDSPTTEAASIVACLRSAKYISDTNSVMFVSDTGTWNKVSEILSGIDVATSQGSMLYIYKVKNTSLDRLQSSLQQLADSSSDDALTTLINSAKIIKDTNSMVFNGPAKTIDELKSLLPTIDVVVEQKNAPEQNIHVYKIMHRNGEDFLRLVSDVADKLQDSPTTEAASIVACLRSAKYISDTNSVMFVSDTGTWNKVSEILSGIDVATSQGSMLYIYKVKNTSLDRLQSSLKQLTDSSSDDALITLINSAKMIKDTNSMVFNGPTKTIDELKSLLPTIDVAEPISPATQKGHFFIYTPKFQAGDALYTSIEETTDNLRSAGLTNASVLEALSSMKWIPSNNSLIFTGDQASLQKVQEIIASIDIPAPAKGSIETFIYKPIYASEAQLSDALDKFSQNLDPSSTPDKNLASAIKSAQWLSESKSFIFRGTTETINRLKDIISSLDNPQGLNGAIAKGNFFIYTPKHQPSDIILKAVEDTTDSLKSSGLSNTSLIDALESVKKIPTTNSLIFTGDPASLQKIQEIISTIDIQSAPKGIVQTFIYKPVYASKDQLTEALDEFSSNLSSGSANDEELQATIKEGQWLSESRSFVFRGSPDIISRLKDVLASLDNPQQLTKEVSKGFFIYKLQYAPGDVVLEDLQNMASLLASSDSSNKALVTAINKVKFIKDNNTLLITGPKDTIDQIKTIIADFDIPSAKIQAVVTPKSEFFIYKPLHQSPVEIIHALTDLSSDLQDSGLVDADLLHTMSSAKVVSSSQSILFTGTPSALEKLKGVLQTVDVTVSSQTPVKTIGATTFLIYKIKIADHDILLSAMKGFADELTKANIQDKQLANTISSARYVSETNSILFTGPQETLSQVEALAEKFDVSSAAKVLPPAPAPEQFVVYSPKYQTGEELIGVMTDFMHTLQASGLADQNLYTTISNLRYIDKTHSLIITGTEDTIKKVEDLLQKFDIPSKEVTAPSISAIDTANFLIYKLQYHKGSEIQAALKQISTSLAKGSTGANKNIIDAIDSLQWIEVTNSLLGTGEPEVLSKLQELIESIDVPLRQVFIEVLVIKTDVADGQNFGLQWGTQIQYLNKTIGAGGNFPLPPTGAPGFSQPLVTATPQAFGQNIQNTTASTPPSQGGVPTSTSNSIPFTSGFDLGVIGDIIMHKGQSFISLGSLVNALQVDSTSSVLMNPKIITQDGHTSTIFVGQNIPFTGSFVSNTTNSTVQTSNIEYRDVGTSLTITPTLGTNNIITLDINQDISEQVPTSTSVAGATVNGIQTTHTSMNTRVHVPDNHFLVLSGMINESKISYRTSIPCLGGLPVVGALFSESDRGTTKNNIIIFLKPIIIDSFEEYSRLTEEEEALQKESAGIQNVKEQFDQATEMVKSIGEDK